MNNDNNLALVGSQLLASMKPNLLLGLGIDIGILNVTCQNINIIQCHQQKEQMNAVPQHNA